MNAPHRLMPKLWILRIRRFVRLGLDELLAGLAPTYRWLAGSPGPESARLATTGAHRPQQPVVLGLIRQCRTGVAHEILQRPQRFAQLDAPRPDSRRSCRRRRCSTTLCCRSLAARISSTMSADPPAAGTCGQTPPASCRSCSYAGSRASSESGSQSGSHAGTMTSFRGVPIGAVSNAVQS